MPGGVIPPMAPMEFQVSQPPHPSVSWCLIPVAAKCLRLGHRTARAAAACAISHAGRAIGIRSGPTPAYGCVCAGIAETH
eukprot:1790758-Rhodomonas_salina.1